MLCELIQNLSANTILLIEDIDHLFESSGNSKTTKKVTMSGLLNIMDGLQSKSGCSKYNILSGKQGGDTYCIPFLVVVFMTCNNINKITPALLRPGRIDVKLHLGFAASEQIRDTFWRFLGMDEGTSMPLTNEDKAIAEKHMEEFGNAIPANKVTTAEIQGYFIDILLEANASGNHWTRDRIYKALFERIPEFLERVERDRKQAEEHGQTQKKVSLTKEALEDKSS
jgi:SpoVK/Ycf46/Vps4 family AAA+-type ATPase